MFISGLAIAAIKSVAKLVCSFIRLWRYSLYDWLTAKWRQHVVLRCSRYGGGYSVTVDHVVACND